MKKIVYIISFVTTSVFGINNKLCAQNNEAENSYDIKKPTNFVEWKETKAALKEEFAELNEEIYTFMERVFANYKPKDPEKKRFNILESMVNRHIIYSNEYQELDSLYKEYVFKKPSRNGEFKLDKKGQIKENRFEKILYTLNDYRFGKIQFNVDNEFMKYDGTKKTPVSRDSIIYKSLAQRYIPNKQH